MPNSHEAHTESATGNSELNTAFVMMANGITRPKRVQRRLEDAARGRLRKPLGSYPLVAEECLDAGASLYNVSRPLEVMLAHLKRRYRNTLGFIGWRDALTRAKKESDEAEACALALALSGNRPEVSTLITFEREASEAIEALETAKEKAQTTRIDLENRLYGEKK